MQTDFNGDLIPQIEEGITKVEWKSVMKPKMLKKTHIEI